MPTTNNVPEPARFAQFLKFWVNVLSDVRSAIVGLLLGILILYLLSSPVPAWWCEWRQTLPSVDHNEGDPKNYRWGDVYICPATGKSEVMQVVGLPEGETFLHFEKHSLRMDPNDPRPRVGIVKCGHHNMGWRQFELFLADFNFLKIRFKNRKGEVTRTLWFRIE